MSAATRRHMTAERALPLDIRAEKALVDASLDVEADISILSTDIELMRGIAEGDRAAFAILMRRYLATIVVFAQRIVFDREVAREISQEAFLRVWRYAPNWKPDGPATFHTWLRRIVINLAISHKRKYREHVGLDVIEEMPSKDDDALGIVSENENRRIVKDALGCLSERQRAAIALYYFDGLSQVDAAVAMDLTPRAFDSLIVRARNKLKYYISDFNIFSKVSRT